MAIVSTAIKVNIPINTTSKKKPSYRKLHHQHNTKTLKKFPMSFTNKSAIFIQRPLILENLTL